jgi:hypothetical protein
VEATYLALLVCTFLTIAVGGIYVALRLSRGR